VTPRILVPQSPAHHFEGANHDRDAQLLRNFSRHADGDFCPPNSTPRARRDGVDDSASDAPLDATAVDELLVDHDLAGAVCAPFK
jgi:hypothetical protein